jgi:hypothetical protein
MAGGDRHGDDVWELAVRPALVGAVGLVAFVLLVLAGIAVRDRLGHGPTPAGSTPAAIGIGAAGTPTGGRVASPANATPASGTPLGSGRTLMVAGTGGLGLTLRAEPTTGAAAIAALAEGARLTETGPGRTADGRAWLRVRDEAGRAGWVAAEFTTPAP